MPRSIPCIQCGVVLNLPAQAEGRKLKCPKCGVKFQAGEAGTAPGPDSSGLGDLNAGSTLELTKNHSSTEFPVMPIAAGDLRKTFELPMMTGSASSGASKSTPGVRHASDALALFDDKPSPGRRKTGAEARAQSRRCPTCGGVVPVGMSICQTCGLDLESGMRVGLDDDLSPAPMTRHQALPIPIAVLGGLCLSGGIALTAVAVAKWYLGVPGAVYFIPVALFGAFAAVQFLRGKSVKILLAALTLGAVIDMVGLIALPIYNAQAETMVIQRTDLGDDPDAADQMIRPVSERLDTQQIGTGITVLFLYAVVSVYLLSPQVHRHFRK